MPSVLKRAGSSTVDPMVPGHHEDDAEEDEACAEASKIQFAYRFTGVGSEFLGGSSLGWSVFFGAIA